MQKVQAVAVFCGSKSGVNPLYIQHAIKLGNLLAHHHIQLVYGGGSVGIMGAVADSVLNNNGKVTGVITKLLVEWEQQHTKITELFVVDDMHTRKRMMYEKSDAAIILAGGNGTLDELFEMLTWNTLKIHEKKVYILNTAGFYNAIVQHFDTMYEQGFLYENWRDRITVCNSVEELIDHLI